MSYGGRAQNRQNYRGRSQYYQNLEVVTEENILEEDLEVV